MKHLSFLLLLTTVTALASETPSKPLLYYTTNDGNNCTVYNDKVIILLKPGVRIIKTEQIKIGEDLLSYIDLLHKGTMPEPMAHVGTQQNAVYGVVDPKAGVDENGLIFAGDVFEEIINSKVARKNSVSGVVDILVSVLDSLCK